MLRFAQLKTAAAAFVDNSRDASGVVVGVWWFDGGSDLVRLMDFTDDAVALKAAIDGLTKVWRLLDGARSAKEIATDLDVDESVVDLAIDDLANAALLESSESLSVSRRSALRRVASAAAVGFLLPAVTSIAAPSAAQAKSGKSAKKGTKKPKVTVP